MWKEYFVSLLSSQELAMAILPVLVSSVFAYFLAKYQARREIRTTLEKYRQDKIQFVSEKQYNDEIEMYKELAGDINLMVNRVLALDCLGGRTKAIRKERREEAVSLMEKAERTYMRFIPFIDKEVYHYAFSVGDVAGMYLNSLHSDGKLNNKEDKEFADDHRQVVETHRDGFNASIRTRMKSLAVEPTPPQSPQ